MKTQTMTAIDAKISAAEQRVLRQKEKYDTAVKELAQLQDQKKLLQNKALQEALAKSKRSYDEIMAFLKADPTAVNEDENPY